MITLTTLLRTWHSFVYKLDDLLAIIIAYPIIYLDNTYQTDKESPVTYGRIPVGGT